MSTAMVSLGIATGFERRYGVLKRLGSTPLSRSGLLTAKTANVLAIEVLQAVLIIAHGHRARLGRRPAGILPAFGLLLIGTVAFAGIGMLMAGTLRAEANLAAANGLFLVLLFLGGMAYPLARLPDALEVFAKALPAAALSECVARRARRPGASLPGRRASRAARLGRRRARSRDPLLPLGGVAGPRSGTLFLDDHPPGRPSRSRCPSQPFRHPPRRSFRSPMLPRSSLRRRTCSPTIRSLRDSGVRPGRPPRRSTLAAVRSSRPPTRASYYVGTTVDGFEVSLAPGHVAGGPLPTLDVEDLDRRRANPAREQ